MASTAFKNTHTHTRTQTHTLSMYAVLTAKLLAYLQNSVLAVGRIKINDPAIKPTRVT